MKGSRRNKVEPDVGQSHDVARMDSLVKIVAEVSTKLAKNGNRQYSVVLEKYMKNVVRCHGLKAKELETFFKNEFSERPVDHHLALAFLKSPFHEEKEIGIRLWPADEAKLRELVFEKGLITGWAANDSACSRILKPRIKVDAVWQERVSQWGRGATNLWTVRASCVGFISTVKDAGCRMAAMDAATFALTQSPFRNERFVQLGAGWILREIGQADRKLADAFIKKNLACFSPEGLRYAVEKLPAAKRTSWINKLKEITSAKRQRVAEESDVSEEA